MQVAALIVAGGRGSRVAASAASDTSPKQYRLLGGRPVIAWTVGVFARHPAISAIQVVIHPDDRATYDRIFPEHPSVMRAPVHGGATRQDSVRAGLEALVDVKPDAVLIHDAARPLVDAAIIDRVIAQLSTRDAVIAAQPVKDTLKRADAAGTITGTVARDELWRAQTPQGFRFEAIRAAHALAARDGRSDFTDDAGLAEWAGIPVAVTEGSERNLKITTAEDFDVAERLIAPMIPITEARTGTGFDVHRFRDGDHVWLCGVRIAHERGLEGHSDADVGLHALTDALLGAIGDGDIGQHFPPSDPQWKGAASHLFLRDAARRVAALGGRIRNVDVTLLCEAPKIGPHRPAMRAAIAEILGIEIGRVGVKATTTEGLGFTGRREGIAAMASATVALPA